MKEPQDTENEVSQLCPTLCDPMTIAYHTPPSMGFSRQEHWGGLTFPWVQSLSATQQVVVELKLEFYSF